MSFGAPNDPGVLASGVADTTQFNSGLNESTNPAQFATLANQTVVVAGIYRVDGYVLRRATDDNQNLNCVVRVGSTNKFGLVTPLGILVPFTVQRLQLAAGATVYIMTLNASVAGAIYDTCMSVTQIA